MNFIKKANLEDAYKLAKLSVDAFLPAHGHSSPKADIESYVEANFSLENITRELSNPDFLYYLIYHKEKLAGFSKVIFNCTNKRIKEKNITKMERLYLLEEFYGMNLGKKLMIFNTELANKKNQHGIWIEVWTENRRAIKFYKKMGFKIVGSSRFTISKTHSNPNYIMFLEF
ncbi:MAG: Spermidine/spermine N(1)-acetyltransferase [Flavobacterium sp. SCGC AAA160-P02]|nr:MAG: Spermidine/spermine N(1)-acetyltransferase [Flavobacterium sp. SCGC AAA160-P02]|tara:strand:- start:984 stop:1499 length:516 start_codon:yes stop_codon:yes gene_type:complete